MKRFFRATGCCRSLLMTAALSVWTAAGATITVANTNDSGPGSLRDAISSASPGDTIIFGVTGTIAVSSALVINTNLTISGPGASSLAISGSNATQVIVIATGVTATISGVTVRDGNTNGYFWGGAILNYGGNLTLDHIVATGNSGSQGAILNVAGALTLTNSMLTGNSASYYGGGVENSMGGPPGYPTATILNSTISGNSAAVQGGGIANNTGTMTLVNSTVAGNTSGYLGGGIFNGDTVTLSFTTVAGNAGPYGSGFYTPGAPFTMKNSIAAQNTGWGNCDGAVTSLGHNLSDDSTCALSGTGDLNNTSAGLDVAGLANNGGPTQTLALTAGSTAVDAVPLASCTDASGAPVTTDQRGIARPQGPACDMGAYERVEGPKYHTCLLYNPTKAVNSGAIDPIKLQLCDASGNDLSSSALTLHATSITQVSTSILGDVQDAGNANPDYDFRFDSTLGSTGGYIFNLSTKGFTTGTYTLNFSVTGDSFVYAASFEVK
jgi:hypothetical protein